MKTLALAMVLVTALVGGPVAASDIPVVNTGELRSAGDDWNGQVIAVEGELVGDYGFRRDGSMWTQLNDDPYATRALVDGAPLAGGNVGVAVRMPAELAEGLDPVGGYRLEGPYVRVTGEWKYHDASRGGESYLEVTELTVLKPGRKLQEGPDWWALLGGMAMLLGAVLIRLVGVRRDHE